METPQLEHSEPIARLNLPPWFTDVPPILRLDPSSEAWHLVLARAIVRYVGFR